MLAVWLNGVCITASKVLTHTLVSKTSLTELLGMLGFVWNCSSDGKDGILAARFDPAGLPFRCLFVPEDTADLMNCFFELFLLTLLTR